MQSKKNNPFFQQLENKISQKIPLWYMRQAGRYLPKYQELRTQFTFENLCKNPELAAKVTLLPLEYLDVDALILFSDILFILELLEAKVHFNNHGPQIEFSLKSAQLKGNPIHYDYKAKIRKNFHFIHESIQIIKSKKSSLPLIGFCGGPLTLLSYLLGDHFKNQFKIIKQLLYQDTILAHQILNHISQILIEYLSLQIDAGVDLIQIFDTWGFQYTHSQIKEFTFTYLNQIVMHLKAKHPVLPPIFLFGKNISLHQEELAALPFDGFSLDSTANLKKITQQLSPYQWIQGNLDPYILYASQKRIKTEVIQILETMKEKKRFIFNLGHGVFPDISYKNLQYITELVHQFKIE